MQRAAIYVRVSTDQEAQKYSPEHQLEACREYAEEQDLIVDESCIYNDAGLSGTEMQKRVEVKRLLRDARQGKFDVVLFRAISRFSRDLSDALYLRKVLESRYGIRIVSIEEGYDTAIEGRNSEMLFTVHAMLAANKSQEMSKAIKRGLRQSAKTGRHIGNITPYGYVKDVDKHLIPDPNTAPIVKEIFNLYLGGMGSKAIAEYLNRRGIPTATRNTLWQASTINAMLHNEVYIGRIVAHKWQKAVNYEESRLVDRTVKKQIKRDQDEWVVVEDAHEAIVDTDTFWRVQELMNHKAVNKGVKRTSNLLAGLMKCKSCGGAMIVNSGRPRRTKVYKYIVCARTRRIGKGACSNHSRTRYDEFLQHILDELKSYANTPDDEILAIISDRLHSANGSIQERIQQLQRQLEQNQEQQMRNLEAFNSGLFPRHIIEQKQRELMDEAERINKEVIRLQKEEIAQQEEKQKIAEIQDALIVFKHMDLYDEMTQRLALRATIDKIEFDDDGNAQVNFAWDI